MHRINLAASYRIDLWCRTDITLSGYYNGQSGRPCAYQFTTAANGINQTTPSSTGSASSASRQLRWIQRRERDVLRSRWQGQFGLRFRF